MEAVSELDFMDEKDEENEQLRHENAALQSEMEHLKEMFRTQEALNAQAKAAQMHKIKMLQQELTEADNSEKERLLKASKLKETERRPKGSAERRGGLSAGCHGSSRGGPREEESTVGGGRGPTPATYRKRGDAGIWRRLAEGQKHRS